jgi:putative ABC transport system permease protein
MMAGRSMFWRIVRRLLGSNRGRLFVVLLALGAGAAVSAALLNLQVDAKRRLTTEFRAFGANVVIAPRESAGSASSAATIDQAVLSQVPAQAEGSPVVAVPFLYLVAEASARSSNPSLPAVVAGTHLADLRHVGPGWKLDPVIQLPREGSCIVGASVAARLRLQAGSGLHLKNADREENCSVAAVLSSGGAEDSQVFLDLAVAQKLASLADRVSLVQVVVSGRPQSIERFINQLAAQLPAVSVHGIRQFTEAEGKIYDRISGLLTATVALVLLLTGLCVMAAMTNVAMERKNDVGLMKAIGGSARRVLRLFLVEAALLGLAGGVLGATAGLLLSIWLGKAVFGVAARPRLIVYPVAVALTVLVSIGGAFPLRRLVSIRPASVFRGEA